MSHLKTLTAAFFLALVLFQTALSQSIFIQDFENRNAAYSADRQISKTIDLTLPFISCWKYNSKSDAIKSIASDNANGLFVLFQNGRLDLLEAGTGLRLWTSDLGGEAISDLAVGEKTVHIVVKSEKSFILKSIGKDTGITVWQQTVELLSQADLEIYLHLFDKNVILVSRSGDFRFFSAADGSGIWNKRTVGKLSALPFFDRDGFLAATEADQKISFFSAAGGNVVRQFNVSNRVSVVVRAFGGKIFFGDIEGNVGVMNPVGNSAVWRVRAGGAQISNITAASNGLLVSSFDNFVYYLAPDSGRRKWKRRLPGKILYEPSVFEGYAVLNTIFNSSAVVIELKTGKIINRINLEKESYFNGGFISDGTRLYAHVSDGILSFATSGGGCGS